MMADAKVLNLVKYTKNTKSVKLTTQQQNIVNYIKNKAQAGMMKNREYYDLFPETRRKRPIIETDIK